MSRTGGGRAKATDSIDHAVGVSGIRKIGEKVVEGQPWATIHVRGDDSAIAAEKLVREAFVLGSKAVASPTLILGKA